uniref:Uncharacterized protein n=1 Tax=Candidatus Kentrum sp. FM TaxID=2126340 RepID=A0A450VVI1_9GAMM|nr:MAG: hypothetical protein BECKFM1743C_GA0114222_100927 [Candidatus Kentron sp. FM]VFJ51055.1 MAG: hypothetical protein BECKFM1743A_GA0114220_100906 [Candidatus Kentron sp. FM]VFK08813.1 MAG: hypothetical protein BECKFM1743B_GA0114221_100826 [Candidatus Kentron sp. FM]
MGRHQFIFGLRGKFRIGNLNGKYSGKSFTDIIASNLNLSFLGNSSVFHVLVHSTSKCGPESREMRPTIPLMDSIRKTKNILLIGIIPLHSKFYGRIYFFYLKIENSLMQRCFFSIQVMNKCLNSSFILKNILLSYAFIQQLNPDTRIKEGQFTHPFYKNFMMKTYITKDKRTRFKPDFCSGSIGCTNYGK